MTKMYVSMRIRNQDWYLKISKKGVVATHLICEQFEPCKFMNDKFLEPITKPNV